MLFRSLGIVDENNRERERYKIPYGAVISVAEDGDVEAGQIGRASCRERV